MLEAWPTLKSSIAPRAGLDCFCSVLLVTKTFKNMKNTGGKQRLYIRRLSISFYRSFFFFERCRKNIYFGINSQKQKGYRPIDMPDKAEVEQ